MKISNFSKKYKQIAFLLIIPVIFLSGVLFKTLAQNYVSSQSLEVSPPTQELNTDAGKTIEIKAKVRNKNTATLPVTVRIEDFIAAGEEGQVQLTDKSPYSITNWTTVTPSTFILKPGEEQEVTAEVKIPKGAAGGRYGSFVFSVAGEKKGNAAALSQEVASLFLLHLSGAVNQNLSITELSAPSFLEFGPIPLSMKLTNNGNIHTKAVGIMNISDMFGQKTADIVITPTNVFPGSARIIHTTFDKKFLIGSYTATAIVYYGTNNQILNASTTFFVFPIRIVAGIIVLFVLLFLVRKRLVKALKVLMG